MTTHRAGVTHYEGATGRKEIVHGYVTIEGTWRASRLNWESWCLEVWLALFRCYNFAVDVIESQAQISSSLARASACHPWSLAVATSAGEKGKARQGVSKGTGLGKPLQPTEVLEAE